MDFKKIFEAAKMPALALIAVSIITTASSFAGIHMGILVFIPILLQFAILGYAGYNGVKSFKFEFWDAAAVGAFASFLSMLYTVSANIALELMGVFTDLRAINQTGMPAEYSMAYWALGFFILLVLSPILGFILGAIGAYFAKPSSTENKKK